MWTVMRMWIFMSAPKPGQRHDRIEDHSLVILSELPFASEEKAEVMAAD